MNKILVGVIVVVALLGLVGSMMVIAVVGSALGIVLISAPVTSSHNSEPEPTIIGVDTHSTADLDGTEWVLTSFNGRSPLAGAEVTLAFTSGQATGSGGCNSYSGPYRVEGEDGLAFSHIANTEMGCLEPEGIMEQETQYLNALRAAARFRLSEGQLEIFTARGEVLIYGPVPTEADTDYGPTTDSYPAVTISPTSGPSGTLVEVIASGFPPNTPVSVGLGPENSEFSEVAQGTTDATGVFTVQVPVQGAAGMNWVFGVNAGGAHGTSAPFHITDNTPTVTISPTSGPSGTLVQVAASGFPPNTPVSVGLGPENSEFSEVAQGTTDATGVFTVQVPVQGAAGMNWVFGVNAGGAHATSAPFHITENTPTVTISPTSGPSGTLVQVVASGFPPNTPVSVGLGPENSEFSEVAQGITNAYGHFSADVAVQGTSGMALVFAVAAEGQPGVASAEVFHVTD